MSDQRKQREFTEALFHDTEEFNNVSGGNKTTVRRYRYTVGNSKLEKEREFDAAQDLLEEKDQIDERTAQVILESKGRKPSPGQDEANKYGLKKLSDTWESRRSKYVKAYQAPKTRYTQRKTNPDRHAVKITAKENEKEHLSPVVSRVYTKLEKSPHEDRTQANFEEKENSIDEIVEEEEKFYLVDKDHPIFSNSPSQIKKKGDTPEEIIQKYERILRDVNQEFKSCLQRNKIMEERYEKEVYRRRSDQDHIDCLRGEIDKLNMERENEISGLTESERDKLNREIANLSFQLNQSNAREDKYQAEKTNLKMTIQNYEVTNK